MNLHFFNYVMIFLTVLLFTGSASTPVYAEQKSYQRTTERYAPPDVILVNQDGKRMALSEILRSDKTVVVQFIFATCTTICPVLSAGYVNLQQKMGGDSSKIHLISISIDPENDSPKVMKEYLRRYRAKPGWDFLTGSRKDIDAVMRAFNAYIPNKMSHYALTLIHPPRSDKWIKISGILSSSEFVDETKRAGL